MSEMARPTHEDLVAAIDGLEPETLADDPLHDDTPDLSLPEPPQARGQALEVRAPAAIVMPAVQTEAFVAALRAYEDLKQRIATPSDIQDIYERGVHKQFYKKSFWRRIANAFNLTVLVVPNTQQRIDLGNGNYAMTVEYKAVAPNGRTASGDGHCGTDESGKDNFMQIAGIAHTRGYNRAVSNLVGGGEVSAEEMDHVRSDPAPTESHSPAAPPPASGPQQESPGYVPQSPIKFGSCKDMFPRDIDDKSLAWYTKVTRENLTDPKKEKWRSGTQHLLDELEAEAKHRSGADIPDDEIPFEPPPAAPVYDVKDKATFLQTAAKAKVFLGDDKYYRILDIMGMRHANAATTFDEMRSLVQMWREIARG